MRDIERPWLITLWELLRTKAPNPNRCLPFCCYLDTVIFYHRPYISARGKFVEFDRVESRIRPDDVVVFEGDQFRIAGGRVIWHHSRWWMRFDGRRAAGLHDLRKASAADVSEPVDVRAGL